MTRTDTTTRTDALRANGAYATCRDQVRAAYAASGLDGLTDAVVALVEDASVRAYRSDRAGLAGEAAAIRTMAAVMVLAGADEAAANA